MGGTDDPVNIVELTPEEHYVAHQLLVKIYPNNKGLIWAAILMTGHPTVKERTNNKIYGWLKRKWSSQCKQRKGENNGSYGKKWYYHPDTLDNIKCFPEDVKEGYIKGRKVKPYNKCISCEKTIKSNSTKIKYCDKCRKVFKTNQLNKNGFGIDIFSEDDIIEAIRKSNNIREVCITLNFKVGGTAYTKIKKIMDEHNLQFQ